MERAGVARRRHDGDARAHRVARGLVQPVGVQGLERAVRHARPHARGVADGLRHVRHVDQAERAPNRRPADPERHDPHVPRRARHPAQVVGERADQARHRGAVTRVVVGVVVLIDSVLARRQRAAGGAHEVPAMDVVHEQVPVVVGPRHSLRLGRVGPELTRVAGHRAAELGMIGQDSGVEHRHHDRGVSGRQVPRLGRMDVVAFGRLVVPPRMAPERVVGHGRDREHRDRRNAQDLGKDAEPIQGRLQGCLVGEVSDPEGREVRLGRARRGRPLAAEFRFEPHSPDLGRGVVEVGDAEMLQVLCAGGRAGRRPRGARRPRAEPELQDVAPVGRRFQLAAVRAPDREVGPQGHGSGGGRSGKQGEDDCERSHSGMRGAGSVGQRIASPQV